MPIAGERRNLRNTPVPCGRIGRNDDGGFRTLCKSLPAGNHDRNGYLGGYSDGSQLSLSSAGLLRRLDPVAGPGWQAGHLCGGRRRFGAVSLPLPVLAQSGSARLRFKTLWARRAAVKWFILRQFSFLAHFMVYFSGSFERLPGFCRRDAWARGLAAKRFLHNAGMTAPRPRLCVALAETGVRQGRARRDRNRNRRIHG